MQNISFITEVSDIDCLLDNAPNMKLAHLIRCEELVKQGNRILTVGKDGREEIVQSIPGLKVRFLGQHALVKISVPAKFKDVVITVGENGYVSIEENVRLDLARFYLGAPNSTVRIGRDSIIRGMTVILSREPNLEVLIGKNALISVDVTMRSTDGHTIFALDNPGVPLNKPKFGIHIGSHVWIGMKTFFLKDAAVPKDCVVAAGSLVTRKTYEANSIIGGVPATTLRKGISWSGRTVESFTAAARREKQNKKLK
ncbi:MAG: hypothetical protein PUB69_03660 [Desulfovibrionaceae bacterium]|nr:hypothetical protein [Desulfovibrionaceae bacterium]